MTTVASLFSRSWFVTWVTRWVPLMEKELLSFRKDPGFQGDSSYPVFSIIHVCSCLSFRIVCPSIYSFWLPLNIFKLFMLNLYKNEFKYCLDTLYYDCGHMIIWLSIVDYCKLSLVHYFKGYTLLTERICRRLFQKSAVCSKLDISVVIQRCKWYNGINHLSWIVIKR